jgi:hypothetical protein
VQRCDGREVSGLAAESLPRSRRWTKLACASLCIPTESSQLQLRDSKSTAHRICAMTAEHNPNRARVLQLASIVAFLGGAIVVCAGVTFGRTVMVPRHDVWQDDFSIPIREGAVVWGYVSWDGAWYRDIVNNGYKYRDDARSNVVFFPLYPASVWLIRSCLHIPTEYALVCVSHLCFLGSLLVLCNLYGSRQAGDNDTNEAFHLSIVAMAMSPLSIFFYAAYTESMFLLWCTVALFAMERLRSGWIAAAAVAAASATRPVGVVLTIPLLYWLVGRARAGSLIEACAAATISVMGIVGYMLYLHWNCGQACAFAMNQVHWTPIDVEVNDWLMAYVRLEPLWGPYVPSSNLYWRRSEVIDVPLFSVTCFNAAIVMSVVALLGVGRWLSVITPLQFVFGIVLVLGPFAVHGYTGMMWSQGRYALVAFPAFVVMGHLLQRAGSGVWLVALCLSAVGCFINAALFASWHRVF